MYTVSLVTARAHKHTQMQTEHPHQAKQTPEMDAGDGNCPATWTFILTQLAD